MFNYNYSNDNSIIILLIYKRNDRAYGRLVGTQIRGETRCCGKRSWSRGGTIINRTRWFCRSTGHGGGGSGGDVASSLAARKRQQPNYVQVYSRPTANSPSLDGSGGGKSPLTNFHVQCAAGKKYAETTVAHPCSNNIRFRDEIFDGTMLIGIRYNL